MSKKYSQCGGEQAIINKNEIKLFFAGLKREIQEQVEN